MKIRHALDEDIFWLCEHDKHITEIVLKDKISHQEVYIAEKNDKKVGWLRYNLFWDNVPFMNMVCVLEEHLRMGIGSALTKHWEHEMKSKGYQSVMTSTQSDEEAQHFFRKKGYMEIGGFKYLDDPFEIIFQKVF